jgi:hypothetical protein
VLRYLMSYDLHNNAYTSEYRAFHESRKAENPLPGFTTIQVCFPTVLLS